MKRGLTKKVKAVPTIAAGNETQDGHFKCVQPKVKRRVRTSVAMIGLTISMGAPNVLLTRQSDRAPAAEPVSSNSTLSKVPTTTGANLGGSINSVEPAAVQSSPAVVSIVVTPSPLVKLQAAVVSTPADPVVEHTVQEGQLVQNQADATASATSDRASQSEAFSEVGIAPSNNLLKQPEFQGAKVLQTQPVNQSVDNSNITPPAATSANQQLKVNESPRDIQITAKQRDLINRLKQNSNRLQNGLAEETAKNSSAPATISAEPASVNALTKARQRDLINRLKQNSNRLQNGLAEETAKNSFAPANKSVEPASTVAAPTTNQASVAPLAAGANVGQAGNLSPEVTTSNQNPVLNGQKPPQRFSAAGVAPDAQKSQAATTNQASVAPLAAGANVGQQKTVEGELTPAPAALSPEVKTSNFDAVSTLEKSQQTPIAADVVPDMPNSKAQQSLEGKTSNDAVLDAQQSQQMPVAADVALDLPKSTVNEPTVVVPSVVPEYQVRAGDTLTAIAHNHGISISELANANRLSNPDQLEINQRIRIPRFESSSATGIGDTVGQEVTKSNENAVLDGQQSQQTTVAADVISNVPKYTGNEPIMVLSVAPKYQVRAGDTLTAIALHYGISVSSLVNANHLSDPDLLQINQQIKIPRFQDSSTVGHTMVLLKRPTAAETTASSVAVPTLTTVSSNRVSVVPLSPAANNSSVSVPTLPMTGEVQANAELIAYQQAGGSQQRSASIPPGPLAGTPSVEGAYTGVGGSISDEADKLGPLTLDEIRLAQATAAKPEPQSSPYAQNLRTDIQRLQQKYYGQPTVGQAVPMDSETDSVVAPIPVPAPGKAAISSEGVTPQFHKEVFGGNLPPETLRLNQPINPEFRAAQEAEIQPATQQKRPLTKDSSAVRATPRSNVATAPMDVDPSASLQPFRGRQQVSPELPPLAPLDNYLPKPFPSGVSFKGYIWPTKGVLTSGYGMRWGRMHKGIDIAAPMGTPVFASAPGVVVRASWNYGGYGNLVDIQHADGSLTRYGHNKRILVQVGQLVKQGQEISEMGSTGFSTGPHCHFEVHPLGKAAVNPIAYLPR